MVQRTAGAGIVNGFYTELEWIEPDTNPGHYASIDNVVRNNIIVDAGHAGVGVYGALNPQVYNNTIVNAARQAQAPIQFGGYDMWISNTAPSYQHISSTNPTVMNNIIVTHADNDTRMVDIRENSITGGLTLDHNLYFGTSVRGTLFIDRNLTGDGTPEQTFSQWKANYGYDTHSIIANPQLDSQWHLTAASPAIGVAFALAGLTHDLDGNTRNDGAPDLGADEYAAGIPRTLPPAPFGAPAIEIDRKGYNASEGKSITVRVFRSGTTDDTVTVNYSTLPGSAKAGLDFTSVQGTLTFAPGETEKLVTVNLLTDGNAEGDEHFLFTLSDPTSTGALPVRLGHQKSASMTVDDLDTPITLHYATKWVSNSGSDVTGDGTEANPWHSLQFAADHVGPGDYVIVTPGNYWGFQLTNDGKADARITFHAMPGVNIDAPNPENGLDGINLEGADYVTIEGFHVSDMPRAGLRSVLNTGAILRENISENNGYWGFLTGWSENVVIENNIASGSVAEHGIYISNSADGAVIRNNLVFENRCSGIQFNADGYLPGDGVHSNNLIEGNVIYGNGIGGGGALNLDGFQDSIVRNNLLYDNHSTGIVLYVGYAADSSTNNLVENNTVVMAADSRWALLMINGSSGNTVVNNVLLTTNPNRGSINIEANSLPAYSNNNILQDLFQLDGYNHDFVTYQAFTGGADTNSIVVPQGGVAYALNDLFVNPAGHDYRLKAGSVAIDAGDANYSPAVDIFQHPRPSGAGVDIGAFESGNSLPSVHFEWDNTIAYEFIGMGEVAIVRTGDTSSTTVVDVVSNGGSAGVNDYTQVLEQVVFKPGETRKTIRVFVNNDTEIETNETVSLSLNVLGDPATLGNTSDSATLHVVSDDAWQPGKIGFNASKVTVNEAIGTATITVVRTGGSNGAVSVNYSTSLFTPPQKPTWVKRHTDLLYPTDNDVPATVSDDFATTAGTITFADGETSQLVTIPIVNDDWHEDVEAFIVTLSDPSGGAELGNQTSIRVRIESDDVKQPGTFEFEASSYQVVEGTSYLDVIVKRTNGGNVTASVRLYDTGAGNGTTTGSAWAGSEYDFLPGQLDFAAGEMSKTLRIQLTDDTVTELNKVFSITLYSPTNDASVGVISETLITIVDNESTFYFKAPGGAYSYAVQEGAGHVPVEVVRVGSLGTSASVRVRTTTNGSAAEISDFTAVDVVLNFAPGESSKIVQIPITDDSMVEAKETFGVAMSNVIGAEQGSWNWTININDNDVAASPGKFELSHTEYSVKENAGSLVVTVNRVGGSDGTVSVQFETKDGFTGIASSQSAWAGSQYTSTKGTLTFAPGETSKTFSVPIKDNTSVSTDKFFTVQIKSAAGGATLGTTTKAKVRIAEDDSAIQFVKSNYEVVEGAGFVKLSVARKGSTIGTASIDLAISSWGATGGVDYTAPAVQTLIFADGQSELEVLIPIGDDSVFEDSEWFGLTLQNAVGAKLGSSLYGSVKILDND